MMRWKLDGPPEMMRGLSEKLESPAMEMAARDGGNGKAQYRWREIRAAGWDTWWQRGKPPAPWTVMRKTAWVIDLGALIPS